MDKLIVWLSKNKEFLGTTVVVIGVMLILWFLGGEQLNPMVQSLIAAVGVFLVVPLAYCKIMLGRSWSAIGFQRGNIWAGIGGSVLALVAAVIALSILWNFTPLLNGYHLPVVVEEQFLFFILYELFFNGFIILLFEVFFRGFVLLLWLRKWGVWSVLVQAAIFFLLLYASGDIKATTIPLIMFTPFAGLIAYQSRSIWYSYGATWFFLLLTDALALIFRP